MTLAAAIQEHLDRAVASGAELGCQCAVWRDGALVADCAAGWCEPERIRPVTRETFFPVFSVGKAALTTAALRMLARGEAALDQRLSTLWPEFTGGGKEETTFADVLSHTSGLFCLPHAATPAELCDWDLMCTRLAAMRPAWPPGTRTRYQAFTYSWLLGEPLARLSRLPVAELLRREALAPCGITEECFFGLPPEHEPRLCRLERAPGLLPPLPPRPTFWNPSENMLRVPAVRRAALPAFNCIATARALARLGAALLQGLVPATVLADATTLHRPANQPIPEQPGYWELFGYGFLLYAAPPRRGRVFGHGGYGGAELLIDQDTRTVFAFTKNRLSQEQPLRTTLRQLLALDLPTIP